MFNEIGFGIRAVFKRKFTTSARRTGRFFPRSEDIPASCAVRLRGKLLVLAKKLFHAQTDQAKCFVARIFALVEERCEQGCGFVTQPG